MKNERLEITLPVEQKRALERRAAKDGRSLAEVTREALEFHLAWWPVDPAELKAGDRIMDTSVLDVEEVRTHWVALCAIDDHRQDVRRKDLDGWLVKGSD